MTMILKVFKNTVFPSIICVVFLLLSCKSNSNEQNTNKATGFNSSSSLKKETISASNSQIIVGANKTQKYLPLLNGKRIGIVANQTSVIFKDIADHSSYTHLVDSLVSLKVNVKKVFSPEHGFRGKVDAGELVKDGIDTKTGLPIVSLYGSNKKPTKEQLEGLDLVVFDIQDVGVRFYTYISTLHYVMEACAEQNIPVLVLDRPNPNGHYVDGPTLEKEHKSFLGMHTIPLVHGMTIGEYAKMINGENWLANGIQCELKIVEMTNYNHSKSYSLPIRPSPNLPNDQSIKLYPSLGLFEGTNINAGRGTEFQFQRYGAPFLNPETMTFTYTPQSNFGAKYPKHKGDLCYGEDLNDAAVANEMTLKWVIKAYENSTDKSLFFLTSGFTKHAGTTKLQKQIESGMSEAEIKATWQKDLNHFKAIRNTYLIYN